MRIGCSGPHKRVGHGVPCPRILRILSITQETVLLTVVFYFYNHGTPWPIICPG